MPYAIIENAIKYSPPRSNINVNVFDGDSINILVTSLGPNIQKSKSQDIFNKGTRGEAAIETGLPGTGMGLTMAKRIVDLFGGTIHVEQSQALNNIDSMDYYETTFTIRLPILSHPYR